jgi:ubiquinone/menaquinone biosynthesis C-methylase UbiE
MFREKKYALTVWTPERVAELESEWNKQKPHLYNLVNPVIPEDIRGVLDVGCGVGMYYDLFNDRKLQYVGVDPSYAMIKRAKKRRPAGEWRVESVFNLPFANNSCDLVFCWSVLYHLPPERMREALDELWRVTGKHLLINFFATLKHPTFSVRGGWNEYLTFMSGGWISENLLALFPKEYYEQNCEDPKELGGKPYQWRLYRLGKK